LNGDLKDDKVFNGIIEAKILGKARQIKGSGNQNFKHNEDVDNLFGLVHSTSPRAYREISKHIPLRTELSNNITQISLGDKRRDLRLRRKIL
jgi:hypothetical protein